MTNLHRLKTLLIAGIVAILALSPAYAKEKFKVITHVYRYCRHGEKRGGRRSGSQLDYQARR
ncbi:iron transport periplasmic-binding protein [Salmonella enterica subsp. enterica]|nr:iron transport periplasmic-binding protein [Salmonella enterica subsp. enterica]